jgi:hypothetical protein
VLLHPDARADADRAGVDHESGGVEWFNGLIDI